MQSLVAKRELNTLQTTTAQLLVLYQLKEPLRVSVKIFPVGHMHMDSVSQL